MRATYLVAGILVLLSFTASTEAPEMVDVPPGAFTMGNDASPLWDQRPAHRVVLTQPFRISVTEITLAEYRRFRPEWTLSSPDGFVWGVTWHDAAAYCEWLGREAGRTFRLPTEAEWEYVCRSAEACGVRNMTNEVREWCADWYGDYAQGEAVDPAGPGCGLARVVRGGVLDRLDGQFECLPRSEYDQPAYRAGMPPGFGLRPGAEQARFPEDMTMPGAHHIGFRVVEGPPPTAPPAPCTPPFVQLGVKTASPAVQTGPDSATPYFRKRRMLPSPPETVSNRDAMAAHQKRIDAAGLDPSFRGHNHSPALEVCDNGDVLLVIFTSYTEYEPEMSLMAARLRFGADAWDMPSRLIDCPGACDNTPLLWNDAGQLRLFWAWSRAEGAFPFQWIASEDSGATWGATRFPAFTGAVGPHSRQPINRAFRSADGTVCVPSDGIGGTSVLWTSRDNMATWQDNGGRSAGRHTVYCELSGGRLLALGGKNTDIDGYMPKAVSSDGGATWQVSRSPFPALAANQRPSLLRLRSGRLFFASDFQKREGVQPAGFGETGSFVALSDDEGETWRIKKLPGAQEHESGPGFFKGLPGATTIGYSVARQAPNGIIHLITTMNAPCLHFEMNEAWILSGTSADVPDDRLLANAAQAVHDVRAFSESYPDGTPRLVWSAGVGDDGRYLLDGVETWFYPDGSKQYEATFSLGRKTGAETLWRRDGSMVWKWQHDLDGVSHWTQWWENGIKKAESNWRDSRAFGVARTWDRTGAVINEMDLTLSE